MSPSESRLLMLYMQAGMPKRQAKAKLANMLSEARRRFGGAYSTELVCARVLDHLARIQKGEMTNAFE